jgi:hypothetical protein
LLVQPSRSGNSGLSNVIVRLRMRCPKQPARGAHQARRCRLRCCLSARFLGHAQLAVHVRLIWSLNSTWRHSAPRPDFHRLDDRCVTTAPCHPSALPFADMQCRGHEAVTTHRPNRMKDILRARRLSTNLAFSIHCCETPSIIHSNIGGASRPRKAPAITARREEHYSDAALHHAKAARCHENDDDEKAGHYASAARGHVSHAHEQSEHAARAHRPEHGSKS